MKINKDDELLASPEEFMIIDKIRKDQRIEFAEEIDKLVRKFDFVTKYDMMVLADKYRKLAAKSECNFGFICVTCMKYKKEEAHKLVQNGAVCKQCWDKANPTPPNSAETIRPIAGFDY